MGELAREKRCFEWRPRKKWQKIILEKKYFFSRFSFLFFEKIFIIFFLKKILGKKLEKKQKNKYFYFWWFFRGLHSKHHFSRASSPTFAAYNTHFRGSPYDFTREPAKHPAKYTTFNIKMLRYLKKKNNKKKVRNFLLIFILYNIKENIWCNIIGHSLNKNNHNSFFFLFLF